MPVKIDVSFDNKNSFSNMKVFWTALLIVFSIVFLQRVGFKIPDFSSQNFSPTLNTFNQVRAKLERKKPAYLMQKSSSFIDNVYDDEVYNNLSSYAVLDFKSGRIIASKNLFQKLPIASLTKLMTAVVVLDLVSSDDKFVVSNYASKVRPTRIGVIPGQLLTVEELLHGALMTSANDAAEVLKEGVDQKYGNGTFVKAMNAKAAFLGLKNTHFANATGFDNPQNYSSSEDLALLTHYALTSYPLISQIVEKDYQFIPANSNHKQFDLYNWNGLLDVYPNILGVKIGNTDDAKYTTIVLSKRNEQEILVVALGAPGVIERDLWAASLLDLGFEKAYFLPPVNITQDDLEKKYKTWQYWG